MNVNKKMFSLLCCAFCTLGVFSTLNAEDFSNKITAKTLSGGLSRPESAHFYKGYIYVSSQDGPGNKKDGSGWISKFDISGKLVKERIIEGLNAPKGIRIVNDILYTVDIDQLVIVDIKKEKLLAKIDIPHALLLNDVVVDKDGTLYLSDTVQGAIYKVKRALSKKVSIELWMKNLAQVPNGLYLDGKKLYVAGWGTEIKPDYKTTQEGKLYSINMDDKTIEELTEALGKLDGLEMTEDGDIIFSALWQDTIYSYSPKTKLTKVLYTSDRKNIKVDNYAINPGDIGIIPSKRLLLIPNGMLDQVSLMPY